MTDEDLISFAYRSKFSEKQLSAMTYDSGPYEITKPTMALREFARLVAAHQREIDAIEIERLRAEVEELNQVLSEDNCPKKYVQQGGYIRCLYGTSSISAYETLQAENESLRKDAERYRHVRKCPAMLLHLSNRDFDAAIDAAIREQGKE